MPELRCCQTVVACRLDGVAMIHGGQWSKAVAGRDRRTNTMHAHREACSASEAQEQAIRSFQVFEHEAAFTSYGASVGATATGAAILLAVWKRLGKHCGADAESGYGG